MLPTINLIAGIVLLAATTVVVTKEFLRDLMMFQQNSYRISRYRRWLSTSGDTTSTVRLLLLVVLFATLYLGEQWWVCIYGALVIVAIAGVNLFKARYKKPLVMTKRVWRLLSVMTLLEAAIVAAAVIIGPDWLMNAMLALIAVYLLSHVVLMTAAVILIPVEHAINRRYRRDAARILASMPGLIVVGITGSYGKTSTKHYLHRILSEKYDTLMTPGSYNTTMGVIRTVREYLKPYNEVFICEMGAKQPGDIKDICDLVHPTIGIITAVGEQHLESFKSIENVQRTKFELADAIPADGVVIVNNDFEYVANRPVDNTGCIRYGINAATNPDVTARDITYDATGTEFTLVDADGKNPLKLHTRLVGECNVSNLIAACIVARRLGVDDEKIRYAVEQIEQVEHRLSVKRTPGGVTIIDDAFNSNPTGSRMAMDVLAAMKGGKRIVVTPGMIELGDKQYELNCDLGEKIASSADVAIIVGRYNRDALVEGIERSRQATPEKGVYTVESFAEAQQLLATLLAPGDIVLYENDLPDTFK